MSKELEVLRAMWPVSVPVADYERMLRLLRTLGPSASVPIDLAPTRRKKRSGTVVGADTLERIRALLKKRPATVRALVDATGIEASCVYAALRQLGAVPAGKAQRVDGRSGLQPSLYALR